MNLRQWFVTQKLPDVKKMERLLQYAPPAEFRCEETMRLFLSGFQTRFRLTTRSGKPTASLRILVDYMAFALHSWGGRDVYQAKLVPCADLPEFWHHHFDVKPGRWYIIGISERLWFREQRIMYYEPVHEWLDPMLPGLMSKMVRHKADGVKYNRTHYMAECPNDWGISHATYEGLFRYSFSHKADNPTGYELLQALTAKPDAGRHPAESVPADEEQRAAGEAAVQASA